MIRRLVASPVAVAALILAFAALVTACAGPRGATGEPATPGSTTPSSESPRPGESPAAVTSTPSRSPEASLPTTTQTAWGRIWDGLPAAFPAYPGAEPADGGEGPASAVMAVPVRVGTVVDWYRQALVAAGYSIEALSGPMEDGSTVIDAVGLEPTCRVQASIGPRGSQTTVSILFAADCPFR